jgi:cysteinyl-tRNA synthetase
MKREQSNDMTLHIYDTLTRRISPVVARDGSTFRIYCCGPTVYRDAHVGNLRTFLLSDLVKRTLLFSGAQVRLVQNITDVGHMSEDFEEDKILSQSKLERRDPFSIARDYEAKFHADLNAINIIPADKYPRASECINMMTAHIEKLIDLKYAYVGEDSSVYFSAEKFLPYGELSGNRLEALKPGHRYEYSEDGAKRFHADWALWKSAGNRTEMIWQTPWGPGFPGWHIECSAMSLFYLDGHVDLHIGGIDLRFPHHENERAQSNPLTGDEAVSLWLHGEHLLFEGRKMSKSSGNVVLLSDVISRGIDPLAVRFCFLENRYRSQMDLSWQSINAAFAWLQKIRNKYQQWSKDENLNSHSREDIATQRYISAIYRDFCDDLDTPRAIMKLRSLEKENELSDSQKARVIDDVDSLFGLNLTTQISQDDISDTVKDILKRREVARQTKDFAKSDALRDELAALGIEVRDSSAGQTWSRISKGQD